MELLISYYITKNYELMKEHWKRNSALLDEGIKGTNRPIGRDLDLGGMVQRLDWSNQRVLHEKELSSPSGFDFDEEGNIYLSSMRSNLIYFLDRDLNVIRILQNKLFNDLHSLSYSNQNLLVTSTGLDSVLELSLNGDLLRIWRATENGYTLDQTGNARIIKEGLDYRTIDYPTLMQTTHINSAVFSGKEEDVYATLFHQGEVVKINFDTSGAEKIIAGLRNPHSVYRISNCEFMVSDTCGRRVLFFDVEGNISHQIEADVDWLQDSSILSNGNIMLADSNNHRLIEIEKTGKTKMIYKFPSDYKIYQVKEVIR